MQRATPGKPVNAVSSEKAHFNSKVIAAIAKQFCDEYISISNTENWETRTGGLESGVKYASHSISNFLTSWSSSLLSLVITSSPKAAMEFKTIKQRRTDSSDEIVKALEGAVEMEDYASAFRKIHDIGAAAQNEKTLPGDSVYFLLVHAVRSLILAKMKEDEVMREKLNIYHQALLAKLAIKETPDIILDLCLLNDAEAVKKALAMPNLLPKMSCNQYNFPYAFEELHHEIFYKNYMRPHVSTTLEDYGQHKPQTSTLPAPSTDAKAALPTTKAEALPTTLPIISTGEAPLQLETVAEIKEKTPVKKHPEITKDTATECRSPIAPRQQPLLPIVQGGIPAVAGSHSAFYRQSAKPPQIPAIGVNGPRRRNKKQN